MARTLSFRSIALGVIAFMLAVMVIPSSAEAQNSVRLNEVQSSNNGTVVDQAGETPDWIELQNPTGAAVNLSGWSLSDDVGEPSQWFFPAGTSIAAGDTLLVFASGTGVSANGELHTNFKLSSGGEFLGLYNAAGSAVSAFDPIPELPAGFSWGISSAGAEVLFTSPTPDAPNGAGSAGLLADVAVAPDRGFYTAATTVTMNAEAGTQIRYTLDGTAPSAGVGQVYTGPITISQTTVLRAVAVRSGWTSPKPVTTTYIFANDIPDQPGMQPLPPGADRASIVASLSDLPVISLTSTNDDNTPRFTWSQEDDAPVAVEMLHPDGTPGFQVDAGAHEVGGASVRFEKDSLRLVFKSEFGESELDYPVFAGADNPASPAATSFKRLTLRMGAHDTGFLNFPGIDDYRSYIRAAWHDDAMLDLGHVNTHNRFVNVMLNGEYWGLYQLREHLDDHFMASYHGGENEDYLGVSRGVVASGAGTSWDALVAASANWVAFSQIVDVNNYIDFMLISEYGANKWDLTPIHNWRGGGPATVGGAAPGFVFVHSDPDIANISTTDDLLQDTGRTLFTGPAGSWQKLHAEGDPEFVALVNERVEQLFFNGGALSESATAQRWNDYAAVIENAVHAEYARWNRMTPQTWAESMEWLTGEYSQDRTTRTVAILQNRGYFTQPHLGMDGVATQSSTCCNGEAFRAIDGGIDGNYGLGSTTATGWNVDPWWQVDLGSVQPIDTIRTWNRWACCPERLSDFYVFVSNQPFTSETVAGTLAQPGVAAYRFDGIADHYEQFEIGRGGRYVRVQRETQGGGAILSLAEVQIFEGVPNSPPTIVSPGNQSSIAGAQVSVNVSANDPEGEALEWTATGLPTGLSVDPVSGQINGTVGEAGTFSVEVTATDSSGGSASTSFSWTATYPAPSRMILNEWNAVDKDLFLKDDGTDSTLGRVIGNGGDWFELVVIEDHLDIRGWTLELSDNDNDADVQEVTDVFTFRHKGLLGDLRAGTIITVSEDIADNAVYRPEAGDWHINLQANSDDEGGFFTAASQSNFTVDKNNWQLVIRDASGNPVFGPAGEGPSATGVNDEEIGELEADPTSAIRPTSAYDDGDSSTFGEPNEFDGRIQDFDAIRPTDFADTTEPDAVVVDPGAGETIDGPAVVISGTATDNVGVEKVAVAIRNVDSGEWLRADGTFGAFQFIDALLDSPGAPTTTWSFNATLGDGRWAVTPRAQDTSDNRDSTRGPLRFDVQDVDADAIDPDTTITSPAADSTQPSNSIVATGQATDNFGVSVVQLTVKNRDTGEWLRSDGTVGAFQWLSATIDNPGQTSVSWTANLTLPDGRWAIQARAEDGAGNRDQAKPRHQFKVEAIGDDVIAPQTIITGPDAGDIVAGGGVTVSGQSSDNVGVGRVRLAVRDFATKLWLQPDGSFGGFTQIPVNIANPGALSSDWSLTFDVPAGEYIVTARTNDAAGNSDVTRPRVRFSVTG